MGTRGCVPGTVMNGSPIGPPSQVPDPKLACNGSVMPMLAIYASDRTCVGSAAMFRFQMLSDGKIRQLPMPVGVAVGVAVDVEVVVGVMLAVGEVVAKGVNVVTPPGARSVPQRKAASNRPPTL